MQEIFAQLCATLRERLALIANEESRRDMERHTAQLQDISERLDLLERQLPANIDPQLRHFLQRRSYSKALEFLSAAAPSGERAD